MEKNIIHPLDELETQSEKPYQLSTFGVESLQSSSVLFTLW